MSTITINIASATATNANIAGFFLLPGDFTSLFFTGMIFQALITTGSGTVTRAYTVNATPILSAGLTDVTVNGDVTGFLSGTITLQNTVPMFAYGQQVYVINEVPGTCFNGFAAPANSTVPAVQSGTVLTITVAYNNDVNSPSITYGIRLTGQPGTIAIAQADVFVDKATAMAAYDALNL